MSNVRGKDKYVYTIKVLKLNIVNLIPRAQNLKTGSTYPTLGAPPPPKKGTAHVA